MHRRVLNFKRKLYKNKNKLLLVIFVLFCCVVVGKIGFSYYLTRGDFGSSASITVPGFAPKVNASYDLNQNIDLATTITNNKNLAPGAVGKFKIDIDFSKVDSNSSYRLYFDRSNIPKNIHFYVDQDLTDEISDIYGVQLSDYYNKSAEHYIYWTWIYSDTPESNSNDSLYMNTNIVLPFGVDIIQRIENNTFVVNDYERPTGRVHLEGNSGSIDFNFDFENISTASNYNIYFDKENKDGVLHLYSDSSFQNEIASLPVYYDGENTLVTSSVYWRLDDSSSTNLYYIVY